MSVVPFWNRVAVVVSPVDEEQTASGIVVPLHVEGDDTPLEWGIITDIGASTPPYPDANATLDVGCTVYWRKGRGVKVRDVVLVDFSDILAYTIDRD